MRSRSRTTQPHSAVCSAGVPGNATFAPTPPPAAASLPSSSRFPMAASAAAPLSRRSVFDAAYIRSEFSAAGVSAHFIPLIWKYASIRQNPRRMAQSRPFPSPLSSSPFLIFFFLFNLREQVCASEPLVRRPVRRPVAAGNRVRTPPTEVPADHVDANHCRGLQGPHHDQAPHPPTGYLVGLRYLHSHKFRVRRANLCDPLTTGIWEIRRNWGCGLV